MIAPRETLVEATPGRFEYTDPEATVTPLPGLDQRVPSLAFTAQSLVLDTIQTAVDHTFRISDAVRRFPGGALSVVSREQSRIKAAVTANYVQGALWATLLVGLADTQRDKSLNRR